MFFDILIDFQILLTFLLLFYSRYFFSSRPKRIECLNNIPMENFFRKNNEIKRILFLHFILKNETAGN